MTYFKIGTTDLSAYVSGLKVKSSASYVARTNAAADTTVDYINTKRTIEVQIIALDENTASTILNLIKDFEVSIGFRNPLTKQLETSVSCIVPENEIEYYSIYTNGIRCKAFNITFKEL